MAISDTVTIVGGSKNVPACVRPRRPAKPANSRSSNKFGMVQIATKVPRRILNCDSGPNTNLGAGLQGLGFVWIGDFAQDVGMQCEVAREALSARLDGERQHVPAARVDAHVEACAECREWLAEAVDLAHRTRPAAPDAGPDLSGQIMVAAGAVSTPQRFGWRRWVVTRMARCALVGVGVAQMAVAIVQISGANFGMVAVGEHGAMTGAHLLNESTAWSLALGCGMVVAAIWPGVALGVATVLGVFTMVLAGYVVSDAWAGQVTAARVASHAPVIVGLVLVLLVYWERASHRRSARARGVRAEDEDIVLPAGASRGRRRGHVRPVDHSAA